VMAVAARKGKSGQRRGAVKSADLGLGEWQKRSVWRPIDRQLAHFFAGASHRGASCCKALCATRQSGPGWLVLKSSVFSLVCLANLAQEAPFAKAALPISPNV
jgi:hypothetical protein